MLIRQDHLLVRPTRLLNRVRAAFLGLALCALLVAVVNVLVAGPAALLVRALVAVAAVGLGVHWYRGFQRGRFGGGAELPEALVIFATLAAAAGHPALPLFAMLFRSLYGPARLTALRLALFSGGLVAVYAAKHDLDAQLSGHFIGLALAAVLIQVLRDAVARSDCSERRLRSVVENASDAVSMVAADGRIRWQSASIRGLLGREAHELEGRAFVSLVHPEDAKGVERHLARPAGFQWPGGRSPPGCGTRTAACAGWRPRSATSCTTATSRGSSSPCATRPSGDASSASATCSPSSARATPPRAWRSSRSASASSRSATANGSRRAFSARSAWRAWGCWPAASPTTSTTSLAVILNYACFLADELPEDDPLQDDLREIEEAARRGASLTRQLLLFAQRKVTRPEVLDLRGVVAEMLLLLDRSLGTHVELSYQPPTGACLVDADPASLEQVVLNLVVNARDALRTGSGRVTVSTELLELGEPRAQELGVAPGRHVRLSVTDDGCGMNEETLARAVEPFFTTKPVGEGTGLGLATVYGVASQGAAA